MQKSAREVKDRPKITAETLSKYARQVIKDRYEFLKLAEGS